MNQRKHGDFISSLGLEINQDPLQSSLGHPVTQLHLDPKLQAVKLGHMARECFFIWNKMLCSTLFSIVNKEMGK